MAEIYVNIDEVRKSANDGVGLTQATQLSLSTGHRRDTSKCSKKRCHRFATAFLALLSVFLLTGLVISCVLNYNREYGIRQTLTSWKANATKMSEHIARLKALLPGVCPTGWNKFRSSCYLLSSQTGSWDEGREDCKRRGADLVVIESSEEMDFLAKIIRQSPWIGLNDREQEGTWKWVNGSPLNFTNWRLAQPDNWDGDPQCPREDCGQLSKDAKWNDLQCRSSQLWVCEKTETKLL